MIEAHMKCIIRTVIIIIIITNTTGFQHFFKAERSQYCVVCPTLSGSGAQVKNIVMEKKMKGGFKESALPNPPPPPFPPFIFHLQSAKKLIETLCPRGLSDILPTNKGENKAFPPHPLQAIMCHCSSYLQKTTNTQTLNGGEVCRLFCSSSYPIRGQCLDNFVTNYCEYYAQSTPGCKERQLTALHTGKL